MNNQSRAMLALVIIIVGIVVGLTVDAIFNWKYGVQSTISWLLWTNSYSHPAIPWGIGLAEGVVGTHLFWGMADYVKGKPPTE